VLDGGLDGEHFRPPQVLVNLVEAGQLGQKTGHGFHTYPRPERPAQ
jgi:3-hydroxyacyl-CoA dehydrogenase